MEILLLKALRENFGHEKMFSFFNSDLHEIKIWDLNENFGPYCWRKISWNKGCHNTYFIINCISKAVSILSA